MNWRDLIAVHPAADLFPMMADGEVDELAKDIEANTLRSPLSIWRSLPGAEWQLLDGRNRVAAMARLPDGENQIKGAIGCANQCEAHVDPWAFVISANIRRRHLSPEQKRELIANVLRAGPTRSNRSIAKLAESNRTTVGQVRAELEAVGEVSIIDTRTDARGHQQPAHKPPPRAVVHATTPRSAPESKEQQLREQREAQWHREQREKRAQNGKSLAPSIVSERQQANELLRLLQHIDRVFQGLNIQAASRGLVDQKADEARAALALAEKWLAAVASALGGEQ